MRMEDIMHDIDRTQLEINPEAFEFEQFEQFEMPGETGEVLGEAEVMERAAELLEVANEQELDRFLGNLIRKAGRVVGGAMRSPLGHAIGGVLKGVARKALPLAGTALGGLIGGPIGANIGSGLASAAGSALGFEAETLNQEDREYEGAKQFVRLAANTVRNAASASRSADPRAVAQNAAMQAARTLAPVLLQSAGAAPAAYSPSYSSAPEIRGRSGRWIRRGSKIVLLGV
jgi:hypothetical protein